MSRLSRIAVALWLSLLWPLVAAAQTELDVSKIRLGTQPCVLSSGSGTPEGAVIGSVCDVYIRTNGTSFATIIYVKASGTGTNTGWVTATSGAGTVTSVALSMPTSEFDVTGSPVTGDGTLTAAWDSQTAKYFFAAPNASSGTPSFRAVVASDIPTLNQNTTGTAAGWTTARLLAGNSVNGTANVAFANKFIVQGTSDSGLSGAQFLGSLSTGLLKNTTTTGVLSIAAAGDLPSHTHSGGDITSGLVGLTVGGTNANLTASTGGIVYSGASALAILSGTATAGQMVRSGSNAAPTWSSTTWPNTATANRVLYATGTNAIGDNANLTFDGSTLTVSGNLSVSNVSNHLVPSATDTYDLGSASRLWRNGFLSTMNALVFAETTQTLFGGYSTIGKQVGDFAADVASGATTINFGEAMTPNDWLLVRAHDTGGTIKAEYIRVLTLVSGTTYNVTRDLAGAHVTDPAWAAGTPWLCLGAEGAGRIDLIAVDGKPRIVMTQQGSAYNTQTDRAIMGNLNTYYGYATDIWGVAFGDYTANNVTIEPTSGVRFRNGSTVLGQLSSTTWTLGSTSTEHVAISSTNVQIKDGSTVLTDIGGGNVTVGSTSTEHVSVSSTAVQLKDGSTVLTDISGGNVLVGQTGASQSNVYITSGAVALRNNTTERIKLNADGSGFLASSNISWTTGGVLTAGGWTIGSADLQAQSGTVGMSSGASYSFWAGDATPASAEFRVTPAGALTATSATITGSVTATTGAIGGFTLGANTLSSGTDADYVALMSGGTNAIQVGDSTFADAKFSVTAAGILKATSGTVGGWTLGSSSLTGGNATLASSGNLTLGTSNDVFRASADDATYRLWIGNATASSAPFRVTKAGVATMSGATVTGSDITLGEAGASWAAPTAYKFASPANQGGGTGDRYGIGSYGTGYRTISVDNTVVPASTADDTDTAAYIELKVAGWDFVNLTNYHTGKLELQSNVYNYTQMTLTDLPITSDRGAAFTEAVSSDASLTAGTFIAADYPKFTGVQTYTMPASNVADLSLNADTYLLKITNTSGAGRNIYGFSAAGSTPADGRMLLVCNSRASTWSSAGYVTLISDDGATGTAAYRIYIATGATKELRWGGGCAQLRYDAADSRWYQIGGS